MFEIQESPNARRHFRASKESRRDRRSERRFRIAAKQSFLAGAMALAFAFIAAPDAKADSFIISIPSLPVMCAGFADCYSKADSFGCYPRHDKGWNCFIPAYRAQLARHSA